MVNNNKKMMLDSFQEYLLSNYRRYCSQYGVNESTDAFITYMIDHDLISPITIKRYTVLREFNDSFSRNHRHKTKLVNKLADKFQISERSIWNMLKQETQSG